MLAEGTGQFSVGRQQAVWGLEFETSDHWLVELLLYRVRVYLMTLAGWLLLWLDGVEWSGMEWRGGAIRHTIPYDAIPSHTILLYTFFSVYSTLYILL